MIPDAGGTFDRCRTQADVERAASALAAEVLPDSRRSVRALLERPSADPPQGEATRGALTAMGWLLAKSGTAASLATLLTLSHRLHDVERADQP